MCKNKLSFLFPVFTYLKSEAKAVFLFFSSFVYSLCFPCCGSLCSFLYHLLSNLLSLSKSPLSPYDSFISDSLTFFVYYCLRGLELLLKYSSRPLISHNLIFSSFGSFRTCHFLPTASMMYFHNIKAFYKE